MKVKIIQAGEVKREVECKAFRVAGGSKFHVPVLSFMHTLDGQKMERPEFFEGNFLIDVEEGP